MLTGFSGNSDMPTLFMKSKGSGSLRLIAEIIREGDPLFLIGVAQPLPNEMRVGAGVSIRDAAEQLKKDKEKMKQLDTNQDGQIDALEWETAVAKHKKELDSQNTSGEIKKSLKTDLYTSTAFVSKGSGSLLVIANDEKDLISKLSRYAFFEVIGGGGAIVFGVVRILKLLHS